VPGGNGGNALDLTTRTILRKLRSDIRWWRRWWFYRSFLYIAGHTCIRYDSNLGFGVGGGGGSESGAGGSTPSGGIQSRLLCVWHQCYFGFSITPRQRRLYYHTYPYRYQHRDRSRSLLRYMEVMAGGFAQSGTPAGLAVGLQICLAIPLHRYYMPINVRSSLPVPVGSTPGAPGLAIKRNGNPLTGLPDGTYNSFQVKGTVAP
jgi:hypothetical protein